MWPNDTPEQHFANMILSLTPEQFEIWADMCSLEDVERATKIIQTASQQLREQMECLIEEDEVCIEEEIFNGNLYDAQEVLSKYTLKGLN